jgi:hypothetical protein
VPELQFPRYIVALTQQQRKNLRSFIDSMNRLQLNVSGEVMYQLAADNGLVPPPLYEVIEDCSRQKSNNWTTRPPAKSRKPRSVR